MLGSSGFISPNDVDLFQGLMLLLERMGYAPKQD